MLKMTKYFVMRIQVFDILSMYKVYIKHIKCISHVYLVCISSVYWKDIKCIVKMY